MRSGADTRCGTLGTGCASRTCLFESAPPTSCGPLSASSAPLSLFPSIPFSLSPTSLSISLSLSVSLSVSLSLSLSLSVSVSIYLRTRRDYAPPPPTVLPPTHSLSHPLSLILEGGGAVTPGPASTSSPSPRPGWRGPATGPSRLSRCAARERVETTVGGRRSKCLVKVGHWSKYAVDGSLLPSLERVSSAPRASGLRPRY
jgi:hypothetical protein